MNKRRKRRHKSTKVRCQKGLLKEGRTKIKKEKRMNSKVVQTQKVRSLIEIQKIQTRKG